MDEDNHSFTEADADAYIQGQADWVYAVLAALEAADLPKLDGFCALDKNFPHGVDPWLGRPWITNAIEHGTIPGVNWLLKQNVNLIFCDAEGHTPLHSCIECQKYDKYRIMEALLANRADVNAVGVNGYTPLHLAVMRSDFKSIDMLLAAGADFEAVTTIDNYATSEEEARICGNLTAADYLQRRIAEMPKRQKRFAGPIGLADLKELD